MDSQTAADKKGIINRVNTNLQDIWSNLSENQQSILKKNMVNFNLQMAMANSSECAFFGYLGIRSNYSCSSFFRYAAYFFTTNTNDNKNIFGF